MTKPEDFTFDLHIPGVLRDKIKSHSLAVPTARELLARLEPGMASITRAYTREMNFEVIKEGAKNALRQWSDYLRGGSKPYTANMMVKTILIPKMPSKRAGRKGTRKGWKRARGQYSRVRMLRNMYLESMDTVDDPVMEADGKVAVSIGFRMAP